MKGRKGIIWGLLLLGGLVGWFLTGESSKQEVGQKLAQFPAESALASSPQVEKNSQSTLSSSAETWESSTSPAQRITPGQAATVVNFVDGDTTNFKVAGAIKKVRYLLIDTPELKAAQPFSKEASDRVQELLSKAKSIRLEYDIGPQKDHYGRDLMYVWADERLVQETLAEEGLCIVRYVQPPNTRYLDQVKQAEASAREKGLGIWSIENYASGGAYATAETTEATSAKKEAAGELSKGQRPVYYAPHSGSKYHYDRNCQGLRKAQEVAATTEAQALELGLTLCGYED